MLWLEVIFLIFSLVRKFKELNIKEKVILFSVKVGNMEIKRGYINKGFKEWFEFDRKGDM